jgi:hypothetical protein
MIQKTTIAIKGIEGQGKSETIKLLREILKMKFSNHIENLILDDGDVKCILEINKIKIGIESQGDPKSRQGQSIIDFINNNCDIIICASRTSGETEKNILNTNNNGYRIIWATNYRSKQISNIQLNQNSANHLFEIVKEIIKGIL